MKLNILLIGCGKMGTALLEGWLSSNIINNCIIVDPSKKLPIQDDRITHTYSIEEAPDNLKVDVVIYAVKPQIIKEVFKSIENTNLSLSPALHLSIAAGIPISSFSNHLPNNASIVRTMPNTPASIGHGITVAYQNDFVTIGQRQIAAELLKAAGQFIWIENEELMDAVTAVSGSGPAYVFLLIESLTQAAIKVGLPEDIAEKLARQTIIGSAYLAEQNSKIPASTLRENVTSPGGTTEAALKVLMHKGDGLSELLEEAVKSATNRSKDLSS